MHTWGLAVVAGLLLVYAATSGRIERSLVTAPIFFVTMGFLAGDEGLGWIDLEIGSGTVRILAEATLVLVLFSDASRIDVGALRREAGVPGRLLGIGLPLTIVLGAALAVATLDVLTFPEALVLAVVLAPTDAALGQAVVTDRRIPSRIRQGLNVESGLNDGLCVPLLFIALAIAEAEEGTRSTSSAAQLVLEQIGWGAAAGIVAGAAGAFALRAAVVRRLARQDWVQVVPLAAAGLAYGIAVPLGGSGFIAAFVGGFVFGAIARSTEPESTYLTEATGQVLNATTFVVFGAAVVGPVLADSGWEPWLYAVLSLTVIRMLPVALAMIGTHARRPTVAFLGWFGPRGLASIVFAVIIVEESALPHSELLLATIAATVVLSVYAHGLTAHPSTDRYVAWYEAHPAPPPMESGAAHEQRWREPWFRMSERSD